MAMPQPSLLPSPRQSSNTILENIAQAQELLARAFAHDCIGRDGVLTDADGCHDAIIAAVRHLLKAQQCLVETPWPVETDWPAETILPLPTQKPEQPNACIVEDSTKL